MSLLSDYPYLKIVQEISREKNVLVYLVGGLWRDLLREVALKDLKDLKRRSCFSAKEFSDFDFAVEKGALKFARVFAKAIKGAYVLLDAGQGCARVAKKIKGKTVTFDFADFRAPTIKEDLALRDFTINAICVDIQKLTRERDGAAFLCDPQRGLKDLREKRIKRISVRSFRDDPLRLMRAFSLKAGMGFEIEPQTLKQIQREKELIRGVSYERIREELFKVLASARAAAVLTLMDRAGLLEQVLPQIHVMKNCPQGTYHHLDVWPHSLETVVQLDGLLDDLKGNNEIAAYLSECLGGNRTRGALLKLGALIHDIGKPDTRRVEKGRVSFHGHEHVGKNIVSHVAKMLKLSIREQHALEDMVRWHLRPGYLSNFRKPTEKAVYRYFRDTKEEAASILLLSWADQRATRGPATTQKDQEHHEKICRRLIQQYFQKKNEKPFTRLINGDDLIKTLRLKPSPLFGVILCAVDEAQMLGRVKEKKEALVLAKAIALKKGKNLRRA